MNNEKRFPCVADLEARALLRLPKFVREYLTSGIGNGVGVRKNRTDLDGVGLLPRYFSKAFQPDMRCRLLGQDFDAPFGVAPMGLCGLIWPKAEMILAAAARLHNIPYALSTVATESLEDIREVAGANAWFQLYTPRESEIRNDLLRRCEAVGYGTLIVTVDVPCQTRREHDIRNGISVPPQFNLATLCQMMGHPNWALRMLRAGIPKFVNLAPYYDRDKSRGHSDEIKQSIKFITERFGLHIGREIFDEIRAHWSGKLLVKGVLSGEDAKAYINLGADGLIVSNHGGRQLDAAPSPVAVLPGIREAVGPEVPVIVDSGARSGLDVARMLAMGADFVMMGRPFMFAVAALDRQGGDHVMQILKAELRSTMGQLGCEAVQDLPKHLLGQPQGRELGSSSP
ncbi:MAG: alpha-hydroxy acid oxidase [bacterium]|nr:alpha-hydroxy acid oxidase [bacterium]